MLHGVTVNALRAAKSCLLVGWGLFAAAATAGCKSDPPAQPSCNAGATHTCKDDSGCLGVQHCTSGSWSDCICNAVDVKTGDLAMLGGACSDDNGCPLGATCLLPASTAWLGGGPPQGLCVADCTSDVEICQTFGNATCVAATRTGTVGPKTSICLPTCDLGAGTSTDLACSAVPSSGCDLLDQGVAGFCRPFCQLDRECASGHCDRRFGVCVAVASAAPLSFGASCDPATDNCEGLCLKMADGAALCSSRCRFGVYDECSSDVTSTISSVCAYASQHATPGNVGYCTPLCNCNDDCLATGFICQAFSTADTQTALQHAGMCVPQASASSAGVPCGPAG